MNVGCRRNAELSAAGRIETGVSRLRHRGYQITALHQIALAANPFHHARIFVHPDLRWTGSMTAHTKLGVQIPHEPEEDIALRFRIELVDFIDQLLSVYDECLKEGLTDEQMEKRIEKRSRFLIDKSRTLEFH